MFLRFAVGKQNSLFNNEQMSAYPQPQQVCVDMQCSTMIIEESPANAKGTRDSSACMKAHC